VLQVGNELRLYYDARSATHQDFIDAAARKRVLSL